MYNQGGHTDARSQRPRRYTITAATARRCTTRTTAQMHDQNGRARYTIRTIAQLHDQNSRARYTIRTTAQLHDQDDSAGT